MRYSLQGSLRNSLARVRGAAWPIVQAASAAGVAWFLAHTVLGHPQPFFAPIAAIVALAAGIGGRGTQAAQMLAGVAVGVVVGELLVIVLGTGAVQVALAAAAAMLAMATVMTGPLPLIQAGASAILVVALHNPETGTERLLDALVGGGIALLVSQVLLPPSPVSLLERAGREALGSLAESLRANARALASADAASARTALEHLRVEDRSMMSSLEEAREKSTKVARRTLRGRLEAEPFRRLDARIRQLDLLAGSILFLSRATCRLLDERVDAPGWLAPATLELARAMEALAGTPGSPDAMRRAREAALEAAKKAAENPGFPDPRVALAAEGIRLVALDVNKLAEPNGTGLEPAS